MIEKVIVDKKLVAMIIRNGMNVESSTFFSPADLYLQVSLFKRPKLFEEAPHFHKKFTRNINRVEQFMYLLDGEIKLYFYDKKRVLQKRKKVSKGDAVLLIEGIHGLKILKDAKAISVKQGPFYGDKEDKVNVNIKR